MSSWGCLHFLLCVLSVLSVVRKIKKPNLRGKRLGPLDMRREPTPPRGRIAYEHPVEKVSWLAAAYSPRLPGQSPVAEAGIRLKVKGPRQRDFCLSPCASTPCALRLLVAFVPLTVAGQRGIFTPFPRRRHKCKQTAISSQRFAGDFLLFAES